MLLGVPQQDQPKRHRRRPGRGPVSLRPKLAAKARLKWDRREGRDILLYPERGLLLNPVAGAIARRCDGSRTAEDIAREVAAEYPAAAPEAIARDVAEFLEELGARGLLEGPP